MFTHLEEGEDGEARDPGPDDDAVGLFDDLGFVLVERVVAALDGDAVRRVDALEPREDLGVVLGRRHVVEDGVGGSERVEAGLARVVEDLLAREEGVADRVDHRELRPLAVEETVHVGEERVVGEERLVGERLLHGVAPVAAHHEVLVGDEVLLDVGHRAVDVRLVVLEELLITRGSHVLEDGDHVDDLAVLGSRGEVPELTRAEALEHEGRAVATGGLELLLTHELRGIPAFHVVQEEDRDLAVGLLARGELVQVGRDNRGMSYRLEKRGDGDAEVTRPALVAVTRGIGLDPTRAETRESDRGGLGTLGPDGLKHGGT